MSATAIDEIEERLHDLTVALRQAGHVEQAEPLEQQGAEFTNPTEVRRAVNAICSQLERWRLDPSEAPDSAKITLAANRLEDVCREALAGGVIEAASLSTGTRVRRKLAIALGTLLATALLMLVPIALIESGVDFNDLTGERKLPVRQLPRGEEATLSVPVLQEALDVVAVTKVEIGPLGGCGQPQPGGATCAEVEARLWPQGRLVTYEIKLPHQAYGLLFALDRQELEAGKLGVGRLSLAATDDTPEGRYEIALAGVYHGYTPQQCELLQRVQGACPRPRTGAGEKHTGLRVPIVQVDVLPGDPARRTGEKRLAEAVAAEKRKRAAERAEQITSILSELEGVLSETEKLVSRKRFESARERIQKLTTLFAPLDEMAQGDVDSVPEGLMNARARLDLLHERLQAFEDKVFQQAFESVTADSNRNVSEESLLKRIANAHRTSLPYVQSIYTGRADEIQRRLEARAAARAQVIKAEQQAREARCGPLPKDAWDSVVRYVRRHHQQARVKIVLGECLTPRLTEGECWEIRCQYLREEEVAVERPPVVTRHEASFFLVRGQVVRQQGG